jgi:hypothetical protein
MDFGVKELWADGRLGFRGFWSRECWQPSIGNEYEYEDDDEDDDVY